MAARRSSADRDAGIRICVAGAAGFRPYRVKWWQKRLHALVQGVLWDPIPPSKERISCFDQPPHPVTSAIQPHIGVAVLRSLVR